MSLTNKVIGYHYTNLPAFEKIISGKSARGKNLSAYRGFAHVGKDAGLPKEAYEPAIEGFLEPEPDSWKKSITYPLLWKYLMGDICREKRIVLLSFELRQDDRAYVVERSPVEEQLHRKFKRQGIPTKTDLDESYRKFFNSRIPVFNYQGEHKLPQLAVWSEIASDRLNVEWVKDHDEVWTDVLKTMHKNVTEYERHQIKSKKSKRYLTNT